MSPGFGIRFLRRMTTSAKIVTPVSNRFYILNFFENPTHLSEQEFLDFWTPNTRYVQKQDQFISAHMHRAVDDSSTRFKWVNFAAFNSRDTFVFGKEDKEWMERMNRGVSMNLVNFPGEYAEISSYSGNEIMDGPKERPEEARFLVTAVAAEDSVSDEELESNWPTLMKTDFAHEQLDGNPSLVDTLLYKRVWGFRKLIRYATRTELSGMDDKDGVELAKMLNQKQTGSQVETFTGFYKIHANVFHK